MLSKCIKVHATFSICDSTKALPAVQQSSAFDFPSSKFLGVFTIVSLNSQTPNATGASLVENTDISSVFFTSSASSGSLNKN